MILLALFLAANLSDYMPPDVQQKTGITSLTRQQQNELAGWLALYMGPSTTPVQKPLVLAENYHGGRVLQLSDGTIWEVAPEDVNYTGLWIMPFRVALGQSDNPIYPQTLTDLTTGTTVRVRQIYTVNPSDIPKEPPVPENEQTTPPVQSQQTPIKKTTPDKTTKQPTKPKSPSNTQSNPNAVRVEPNQDQLPGITPGPGQGGPSPSS